MTTHGQVKSHDILSLVGSYAALPGPDWGGRITLEPGERFQLRVYNISPEGQEEIAVKAGYHRKTS